MEMEIDRRILEVFHGEPWALELYQTIEQAILGHFSGVTLRVSKTQVAFRAKYGFAWAWPPIRRMKDWPERCILLSFGLEHELKSPRIAMAVQPYPNRWTHHFVMTRPEDLDDEVMGWLAQAHVFGLR